MSKLYYVPPGTRVPWRDILAVHEDGETTRRRARIAAYQQGTRTWLYCALWLAGALAVALGVMS